MVKVLLRDVVGLAGCGLVSYGAWIVHPAAGSVVAGLFLLAGALIVGRT